MFDKADWQKYAGMLYSQRDAAIHCVMVRIVCILHMNKGRHGMACYVSDIHMVYQSALWCCWAMYELCETKIRHEAQYGRVLTM